MGNKYTKATDFKLGELYHTPNKSSILRFVSYGINMNGHTNLQFEFISGNDRFLLSTNGLIPYPYHDPKLTLVKFTYGH